MKHWKKIAVITADSFIDRADAFASKPAPTVDLQ
jgi:hypothetical protein